MKKCFSVLVADADAVTGRYLAMEETSFGSGVPTAKRLIFGSGR